MITFKPITWEDKPLYEPYLFDGMERGCEYSLSNLYLWGNQQATILYNHMVLFSQFNGRSIYPYPIGQGDKKPVLDALMADAKERGIPFRLSGLYGDARETLENLYPGRFDFQCDRGSYDYVYAIDDLADLGGSKYHKKRNHCNKFRKNYPDYTVEPLNENKLPKVRQMIDSWYEARLLENPDSDYRMERAALEKALCHYRKLGMEGLVLFHEGNVLAVTLGSQMSKDTFDVHFEKARWDVDGAYAIINFEFARYIRDKYPHIQFLDREEDMGLEGLRKSKQSYYPHHLVEKCFASLKNSSEKNS